MPPMCRVVSVWKKHLAWCAAAVFADLVCAGCSASRGVRQACLQSFPLAARSPAFSCSCLFWASLGSGLAKTLPLIAACKDCWWLTYNHLKSGCLAKGRKKWFLQWTWQLIDCCHFSDQVLCVGSIAFLPQSAVFKVVKWLSHLPLRVISSFLRAWPTAKIRTEGKFSLQGICRDIFLK